MEIALWCIFGALLLIVVLLVLRLNGKTHVNNVIPSYIALHDPSSGQAANVIDNRLVTRSVAAPTASFKSDEGMLVAFAAGLLDIPLNANLTMPVLFFRNDNRSKLNFYVDFIAYSWHPLGASNPFAFVSMIYDCSVPGNHVVEPIPISMNQNFPNAARDNGVFVRAWDNVGANGMDGSTGGRGTMIFTLEDEFHMIPFEGKLIIGPNGTQRFDIQSDAAGKLRLAVVGWFAESI